MLVWRPGYATRRTSARCRRASSTDRGRAQRAVGLGLHRLAPGTVTAIAARARQEPTPHVQPAVRRFSGQRRNALTAVTVAATACLGVAAPAGLRLQRDARPLHRRRPTPGWRRTMTPAPLARATTPASAAAVSVLAASHAAPVISAFGPLRDVAMPRLAGRITSRSPSTAAPTTCPGPLTGAGRGHGRGRARDRRPRLAPPPTAAPRFPRRLRRPRTTRDAVADTTGRPAVDPSSTPSWRTCPVAAPSCCTIPTALPPPAPGVPPPLRCPASSAPARNAAGRLAPCANTASPGPGPGTVW
ncbi:hypothetical protein HEP81_00352 [Streptomyces griseofuscus]|uniref:Uncharacterized protein n=1 Tax=Streptomyces griseofuscus TaxID=146922 RepID=A0A7H1PRK9_9ACTN|nr:hypothetical protein HEP81_00352 [Streptomyces griseofuscus]